MRGRENEKEMRVRPVTKRLHVVLLQHLLRQHLLLATFVGFVRQQNLNAWAFEAEMYVNNLARIDRRFKNSCSTIDCLFYFHDAKPTHFVHSLLSVNFD